MGPFCFNERQCNIKHTNWTDNGKEMHNFRLHPYPNIDRINLRTYFNGYYDLINNKTMRRITKDHDVCLVVKDGFLTEAIYRSDESCTDFYYDYHYDRLHVRNNPYFCFRAKGYKKIIYGPCGGCDIGILTPLQLDPCPNNLQQLNQFNETHCNTRRGVRLCDPRCMRGPNFHDLTWTKIGVNYKSSCYDCSCIHETKWGECIDNILVNPGYYYFHNLILSFKNEYVAATGSYLYLSEDYKIDLIYAQNSWRIILIFSLFVGTSVYIVIKKWMHML